MGYAPWHGLTWLAGRLLELGALLFAAIVTCEGPRFNDIPRQLILLLLASKRRAFPLRGHLPDRAQEWQDNLHHWVDEAWEYLFVDEGSERLLLVGPGAS